MTAEHANWLDWFKDSQPEHMELPGEWEEKCNELQRMILLRCFRQVCGDTHTAPHQPQPLNVMSKRIWYFSKI